MRPGEYKIKFRAAGTVYSTEWYQDNHYTFNPADVVTLSSLSDNLPINAELGPGGSISGQVTDIEGTPIVDALVKVYDSNSDDTDSPIEFGTTGEGGIYTVTGLPEGHSFKVRFFEREGDGSGAGLTEWYDNVSYFTSATTVNAGDTGIDAVLESRFNWLIFTPAIIRRPIP
ncbi:MAG: carboxypeptidase regulatory-like domain-containing protein [Candidatus Electrothrix sp. LOE1_4_5]|nr:carboxypeptidase regulatory-like domain-containing protein [Candidatus Electrothrix gigas]